MAHSRSSIRKNSQPRNYPILALPIAILISLMIVLVLQPLALSQFQMKNKETRHIYSRMLLGQSDMPRPLMFQACNGFANQRLSIVFGILAGILSKRNLLLPRLPLNGEQRPGSNNIDGNSQNTVTFSEFYNITILQRALAKYSLFLLEIDPSTQPNRDDIHEAQCGDLSFQQCLERVQSINKTIDIGCGFPANLVTPEILVQHETIFNDVLTALVPVNQYKKEIDQAVERISSLSGAEQGKFNLLHLRVEEDWIEHCAIWSNIPDGIIRDNCMNNTDNVGEVLIGMLEDPSLPLVISYNQNVDPIYFDAAMQSINQQDFKTITNAELDLKNYQREVSAMINYFMGLQATQFVGNSVSSFSALMLIERRCMQNWAAYYNGGNIPMQVFVPLYQMPLVLVDTCQDIKNFRKEVLPVLIQGIVVGTLDAHLYCDSGEKVDLQILDLASQYNINVIQYKQVDMYTYNQPEHALYAISMLPWLRQYGFIIFTSANIWFERQVSLDTFRVPLPQFQRDYTFQGDTHSKIRLINSQFVRDQIIKKVLDFKEYSIEVVSGNNIVSQFVSQGEAMTPITIFNSSDKMNKWEIIKSCIYPAFQQHGYCNEDALVA